MIVVELVEDRALVLSGPGKCRCGYSQAENSSGNARRDDAPGSGSPSTRVRALVEPVINKQPYRLAGGQLFVPASLHESGFRLMGQPYLD